MHIAVAKKSLSRKNRAIEQAFVVAQRKGENTNVATSHGSSMSGKSHVSNASIGNNSSGNFCVIRAKRRCITIIVKLM